MIYPLDKIKPIAQDGQAVLMRLPWVGWAVPNGDPLMPILATTPQHNAARSRHPGGVHVCFADGTVRFVTNGISLATWQALGTIDGNEVVGPDY